MAISLSELKNNQKQKSISIKKTRNYIKNNPFSDAEKQDIYDSMLSSRNNKINAEKDDKSLLKTASAGLQYLGQGVLRGLEGVFVDAPLQIAAGTRKLFGDDEGAKGLMDASDVSLTNMLINKVAGKETNPYKNNNQNLWNKEVDKNSYIKENNLGGKIVSGIGEMLPTIGIGSSLNGGSKGKQIGSSILLGTGAFSSGTNEAYRESGDLVKSMLYGLGNAGTELLTEKISSGIPGLKQIGGATKKEKKKNYLKSTLGEGVEEVISSLANPILQTTYKGSEALNQYGTSDYWKGVLESGVVGSTVGGILDAPNIISNVKNTVNSTNSKNMPKTVYDLVQQEQNSQNSVGLPIVDNNGNIVNSNKFQYVKSDNTKIDNLRKSANKYFNNSVETQNLVNTIEKVISDKNYNVVFDNTIKNKNGQSVNAQITTNNSGEVEIKINPNSNKAGEFLLTHEITHAIETDSMKKLIVDYASKNTEFNQALESLKQTYGTDDVSSEVVADISGQLFGNQEFINSLSMEQPSVFKKIYNKIIELANKITGNSREALFIRDLRNKWEEAYRNTTNEQAVSNLNTNPVFSIQTDTNGNRYVNVDTDQDIFNGKSLLEQNKIARKYILDHFRENGLIYNDENINVNSKTAVKYTNPKEKITRYNKNVKNRISTELDNLLSVSKKISESSDKKNHSFAKDGWEYYQTLFNIDGNYFTGILNIGKNGNQKTLYDINNIKKTTQNGKLDNSSVILNKSSFSKNNISQSSNNVKSDISTKQSMQNQQNNTQWQDFLEQNYKSTGTRTDMRKLLPTQEDIRKMELKDTKLPTRKTLNNTKNNHISNESKEIAQKLNETIQSDVISTKQRSWVETSTESDVLKNKVLIKDLDTSKINYVPISNKTTLEKANSKLDNLGYDKAVEYIQSKLNDSSISLEDIALAERLIQESAKHGDTMLAADLIMDTAILGTELGRKTQILSMIQRLTPEGQLKHFQKIVKRAKAKGEKSFQNVEITPEMVDLILKAYNQDGTYDQADLNSRVEQFKQKVADQLTTSKAEKINAWRYLSMLGNPKTHIRNLLSNVAMMGTTKVKNAMARTMEMALPAESRTKTWKKPTQVVSDFAKQTTAEMKDIITGEGKYSEKGSIESKKQIFKSKTLEKLSDFNSNALSAEDWFFSKRAFESSLREYLTAQGIKTQTDIENNSQIVEKAKMYALEQSEIATFRQYSWLANQIGKIERKNAGTKLLVGSMLPFKKTPINVAKAGVKYSPIGLIKSISYDAFQLKRGNIEASQFIDNLAQGMTGTSLALLGYALAKAGILNGAGDDDKEGKYDYYLGKQSYSLKVGGKTFSISWLSPVAMPLLVGANAYEKLEEGEDWDMNVIVDTLAQTLDPLSEMSFVSSLTDVLQSYQMGSAQMISEMGQNITQNYISQFFPTLFSQLASTLDDTKRSTSASKNSPWKFGEETIRKIMYKIPGLRNQLEASTDIWGNEIKQNENIVMRAVENFLAPYTAKNDTTDYLDRELKNIYNKTGETGVIPGIPQGYLKYKDETYYMSAEEYTKYKKTYGTIANQYLKQLIGNSNYKNASDEEKATMIEQMYKYSSAKANEEYFESQNIEYSSDVLKDLEAFEELNMNNTQIAEYVSLNKLSSSIKNDDDIDSINKKSEISKLMANSNLNDEQLAYLYEKYYSSEEALKNVMDAKIPVKDFIRFNSQEFTTDYYSNGTAVPNSRKNKVINYVNSLNLSIPQKAMLIKMEYSSYDRYDSQIINYINNMNYTKFEKASILKQFGINSYDTYIINHIKSLNITLQEKTEMLEELGFTVRNGRVYS